MISVGVNIALGAALWFWLPTVGVDGAIGLAIATSVAGWINVFLLAGTLAREKVYRIGARAWSRLVRLGLACAVMGAFVTVCACEYPLSVARLLCAQGGRRGCWCRASAFVIFLALRAAVPRGDVAEIKSFAAA